MAGTLLTIGIGAVLTVPAVGEELGPVLVAGGSDGIAGMVAAGQEAADRGTASSLREQMRQLYTVAVGTARTEPITDAVAHDPSIVPDRVRRAGTAAVQDYLRHLAGVTDGDSMLQWDVNGQAVFSGEDAIEALQAMIRTLQDRTTHRVTVGNEALALWRGPHAERFRCRFRAAQDAAAALIASCQDAISDIAAARDRADVLRRQAELTGGGGSSLRV